MRGFHNWHNTAVTQTKNVWAARHEAGSNLTLYAAFDVGREEWVPRPCDSQGIIKILSSWTHTNLRCGNKARISQPSDHLLVSRSWSPMHYSTHAVPESCLDSSFYRRLKFIDVSVVGAGLVVIECATLKRTQRHQCNFSENIFTEQTLVDEQNTIIMAYKNSLPVDTSAVTVASCNCFLHSSPEY